MNPTLPSRSLTIYLSKAGKKRNSLIRDRRGIKEQNVAVGGTVNGRLLIKLPDSRPPSWADFFAGYVDPGEFGKASSCSAALLVPVQDRWVAVTFGQGRHLLADDSFEDRFGLRVALNSIDEKKIRSMDKQTFDAISRQTREQARQEANAGEFGFDVERDMLRAVTGAPRNSDLGTRLTGIDALNAHVRIELGDLYDLLELYYRKFFETTYRDSFPWVDQIAEVTDSNIVSVLNQAVIKMIREKQFDQCWLAVPGILDWSLVSGFRYSQAIRSPELYDIHLRTFLESLKHPEDIGIAGLQTRKIFCMGENDTILKSWSVFNCLYCELDHSNRSYVLNAGNWYVLEDDFVKQVNDSFARIPKYSGTFPDYDVKTEGEYNMALAASNTNYHLMDRDLTYRGGAIEFCDLLSKTKELIHIKRYGGSSTLSHLFYQGVVSAEFFQVDPAYRELIRSKLPKPFRTFGESRPKFEEFQVVFGIISRSDKPLTLPFFSRVGIRHAVRRLEGFGYKVSLAKIGVSESRRKFQKIRPVQRRNR